MICSTLLLWKKATPHIIGILPQSRNQCHTLQAVDNVMSHDNHSIIHLVGPVSM